MHRSFSSATSHPLAHHHVAISASTNSDLLHWLETGRVDKTQPYLLTAGMQTAGRGQYKRTWQSPIGNIYLSLYHPLSVPLSGLLSLVVGYQITRLPIIQNLNKSLRQAGLPSIGVKWVNDIGYYDNPKQTTQTDNKRLAFNKLAGTLIEPVITDNRIVGVVIGVGINIETAPVLTQATQEGMDYHAVSLNQLIERTHTLSSGATASQSVTHSTALPATLRAEDLYLPVSTNILKAVQQFVEFRETPYPLIKFINEYSAVNVLAGQHISVLPSNNATPATPPHCTQAKENGVDGVVLGIDTDGSLKIEQQNSLGESETKNIYTGTIQVIAK